MASIDEYNEVKDCTYKDEHYSVRDNGAIMRHQRDGKPKRKLDDVWTFGTQNVTTRYMDFCGERVHRIVATAFHGEAPSDQYVVDHIDTNRSNNRPENLRWLTKLENTLSNEATRKKVELICGSIEAFLENPQLLWGHESIDKNFKWMRNVTKEEAQNCLENWSRWAKTVAPDPNYKKEEHSVGEWIYNKPHDYDDNPFMNKVPDGMGGYKSFTPLEHVLPEKIIEDEEILEDDDELWNDSLTPSAVQFWNIPTKFPCCPAGKKDDGLYTYMENLKEGNVFSSNTSNIYYVIDRDFTPQKDVIAVLCTNNDEEFYLGKYALQLIKIRKGKYAHYTFRRFGDKKTALHFYNCIIGKEKMTDDDIIFLDT